MGRGKVNEDAPRREQLEIGSEGDTILGAEVHAFRHDPSCWPSLLDALVELGATHVVTLVPWAEHEPSPGESDFGAMRPRLDVGAFLDLAAERGLRAVVRIGPRVRADLSLAGLPEHVVFDRASMARSARGGSVPSPMPPRIFPWPSYASDAYREHVRRWFGEVAAVLAPRLSPAGIVDAVEVEDAAAVLLRAGAYARDYHPDSVAAFRAFLEKRYATPEELSASWGVRIGRFEDVAAPTRFSADSPRDLPRHLDWARFQEHCVADYRAFLRRTLDECGLGRARTCAVLDATSLGTPSDAGAAASVLDRVGVELTSRVEELSTTRRRMSPLATVRTRAFARVIVGGSPFGRARTDEDSLACVLLAVAFGARDLQLSMAVAHERWWGSPIDVDGRRTPIFDRHARLLAALRELQPSRLVHHPDIVVLVPREYLRLARVTHLFGPLGAGILDFVGRSFAEATLEGTFGFGRPIQSEFFAHVGTVERALEGARLPFAFADVAGLSASNVTPRMVCVPTFDFVDDDTRSLVEQLAQRGARIVAGPVAPTLDGAMNPLPNGGPRTFEPHRFADDAEAIDFFVQRARDVGVQRLPHDPASRTVALPLRDPTGLRGYVVVNPDATETRIDLDSERDLRDPVAEELFPARESIPMEPHAARLLLVAGEGRRASRTVPPGARRAR